jgi:c-di-GMP-binding flagellar brake protein YcgR
MKHVHAVQAAHFTPQEQIERIAQRDRIADLIMRAQRARALLSVTFRGQAGCYSSALLKVTPEQDYLLLDELYPLAGHWRFMRAARAVVRARLNGALLEFNAELIEAARYNAIAFYKIAFPGSVRYTQRRRAHRVALDPGQAVPLLIGSPGAGLYRGVLRDLSVGGVGAQFTQQAPLPFKQGELLPGLTLQLSPSRQLNSRLEVRFLSRDGFQGFTRLGGRFIGLEAAQQQLVERTVAALERKRRRQKAG